MDDKRKGDRIWLVLCTATGVVVDVTLNKYASALPEGIVIGIWAIPLFLFVVWFWRVERTTAWVKYRFLEHPVSYVLMFLILIPFAWQATATLISKVDEAKLRQRPIQQVSQSVPQMIATPLQSAPGIATITTKAQKTYDSDNRVHSPAKTTSAPQKTLPGAAQSNSGDHNIQQITNGPNSPNIAGNDNQVSYSDTSELPILSQSQIASITQQMIGTKFKVRIHYSGTDREAGIFADDLVKALKAAGWDADWLAGLGGIMTNAVPIVMGVRDAKNASSPAALKLIQVISATVGFRVAGVIEADVPDGELDIAIMSHPLRRPN